MDIPQKCPRCGGRVAEDRSDSWHCINCRLTELYRLRELLQGRAGKLLNKGKYFVVVAHDEPYFSDVYNLIRRKEKTDGTWTEEDERIYLRYVTPGEEEV